jgi:hypothetical protein
MAALEAAVWVFGKQTMGREKGFPGKSQLRCNEIC